LASVAAFGGWELSAGDGTDGGVAIRGHQAKSGQFAECLIEVAGQEVRGGLKLLPEERAVPAEGFEYELGVAAGGVFGGGAFVGQQPAEVGTGG
jgi:hypothetical protein